MNFVLIAMPNYVMQSISLPKGLYEEINSIIRGFLFGSSLRNLKINLMDWKSICPPKNEVGIGIKSTVVVNASYMMKLCWHF